ncbi:6-phosphofructo-2-kinase [Physcia stellaris]|nr:6-phosphofructo-2-kinase [Physcia stellaris]
MSSNWRARDTAIASEATATPHIARLSWVRPGSGETISTQPTVPTESTRRDEDAKKAISEGRRLYIGNLPYMAKTADVAGIFAGGDYVVERISMSLDPFTGRNPSYCFVDLQNKQQADKAIVSLNGLVVLGRPVKIGPGVAKPERAGLSDSSPSWKGEKNQSEVSYDRWERNDAVDHWEGYTEQGRRVFVGVYHGCRTTMMSSKGYDNFFMVTTLNFATADEAEHAVKAMNGVQSWGVKVRVAMNDVGDSWKVGERQAWDEAQLELQTPDIVPTPGSD